MSMRQAFVLAVLAAALPLGQAHASPQVLALLATNGATPLRCEDGVCSAELSAYCLQRERSAPQPGRAYEAAGEGLTLVVTGRDGTVRRLPAEPYVRLTTERSYTAVRVTLPGHVRKALGATAIAIEVDARVALVPEPEADDPAPQSEADIALATGPQRRAGARLVDGDPVDGDAVRLTNAMINALPTYGRADPVSRGMLWRDVVAPRAAGVSPESLARAGVAYESCQRKVAMGRFFSLRRCLETRHDSLMIGLNVRYWDAGPGS